MAGWADAWSAVSTALTVVDKASSVYSTYTQTVAAQETADAEAAYMETEAAAAEAAALAEARYQKASLLASQGASGTVTSTVGSSIAGIDTTLDTEIEDLWEETNYNINATEEAAEASLISGISEMAVSSVKFSDTIGDLF